jgi:DNA mismatch repair ATPase MutS
MIFRQIKGLITLDSTKAGIKFRTPKLDSRNSEYLDLMKSYDLQSQAVIDEIVGISFGYVSHFQALSAALSALDCLVSFATASLTASPIPYVKPSLNSAGRIGLKQCRHPCIEQG